MSPLVDSLTRQVHDIMLQKPLIQQMIICFLVVLSMFLQLSAIHFHFIGINQKFTTHHIANNMPAKAGTLIDFLIFTYY